MSSNPYWQLLLQSTLVTLPEWGIAYYHPHIPASHIYDWGYWAEYQRRALTDIGYALNAARIKMVREYEIDSLDLIDIGIGSGAFVESYGCWGYDINPHACGWLAARNQYLDPKAARGKTSMTFWDSLEHIVDPKPLLDVVTDYVFVSTPIYANLNQKLLGSKHYKPNEHVWYFTHYGLQQFMKAHGFTMLEHNDVESKLGRESIGSYVFKRAYVSTAAS